MTTTDDPKAARRHRGAVAAAMAAVTLVGTVALATTAHSSTTRRTTVACPAELTAATCYTGQGADGAYYTMAVPERWNRSLVVFAHGGPDLAVDPASTTADLSEWAVMVNEGYAWAGPS